MVGAWGLKGVRPKPSPLAPPHGLKRGVVRLAPSPSFAPYTVVRGGLKGGGGQAEAFTPPPSLRPHGFQGSGSRPRTLGPYTSPSSSVAFLPNQSQTGDPGSQRVVRGGLKGGQACAFATSLRPHGLKGVRLAPSPLAPHHSFVRRVQPIPRVRGMGWIGQACALTTRPHHGGACRVKGGARACAVAIPRSLARSLIRLRYTSSSP